MWQVLYRELNWALRTDDKSLDKWATYMSLLFFGGDGEPILPRAPDESPTHRLAPPLRRRRVHLEPRAEVGAALASSDDVPRVLDGARPRLALPEGRQVFLADVRLHV